LKNNQFPQSAISHRELNEFLIKAKKDTSSNDSIANNKINEEHEFNDLVKSILMTFSKAK